MRDCQHRRTEPVILHTGEHVGDLCADCLVALPAGYGCTDCEWNQVQTMSGHVVRVFRIAACPEHERHTAPQGADPCE